jgi:transmembrane sensor
MDRPDVDQLMAWRRNEAAFDDVPLSDAVAEMNRYSRQPIGLVGDESFRGLRISGLFRTGDNVAFARAVAALHGLVARDRQERVACAGQRTLKRFGSRTPSPIRDQSRVHRRTGRSFD